MNGLMFMSQDYAKYESAPEPDDGHILTSSELKKPTQDFEYEEFAKAIEGYQRFIEKHADESVGLIDGLGQVELSLGYYEWYLFQHYKKGVEEGMYVGTVYDALSLCFQAVKNDDNQIEKGIKWFR